MSIKKNGTVTNYGDIKNEIGMIFYYAGIYEEGTYCIVAQNGMSIVLGEDTITNLVDDAEVELCELRA